MNSYQQQSLDLAHTQQDVLEFILQEMRRAGLIKSTMEMDAEKQQRSREISPGAPLLTVRPQTGRTDSTSINRSMQEVDYDLQVLFAHLLKIDATLSKHQTLNQSVIQSVKLAVKKLKDELNHLEDRLTLGAGPDTHTEAFRDPSAFEPDQALYGVPEANRAALDLDREGVKLPVVFTENSLVSPTGLKLARIAITRQLGGAFRAANSQTGVEKAIDTSLDTFWSETVLVNEPIRITVQEAAYTAHHGALCELEIGFDLATVINEISFSPFAEYPVTIGAVLGYTTDNATDTPVLLVGETTLHETAVFSFPDTAVKLLRIVLNQVHYTKADLLVSTKAQRTAAQMLAEAPADPDDIDAGDMIFAPVAVTRYEQEPSLLALHRQMATQEEPDIERLMALQNEDRIIPVSKYAYSYGMADIGVKRREYAGMGVFVSSPIPVKSSVRGIRLEVAEERPEGTDIEYFVSTGGDWLKAAPGVTLDLVESRRSSDGTIIPSRTLYRQQGTDPRGRVSLPAPVFVNMEAVNAGGQPDPIMVTVTDEHGSVVEVPEVERFGRAGLQFRRTGPRQIQLSQALGRNMTVAVDFPFIVSEVRVKAVLTRTSKDVGITPVLKDYALHLVR